MNDYMQGRTRVVLVPVALGQPRMVCPWGWTEEMAESHLVIEELTGDYRVERLPESEVSS